MYNVLHVSKGATLINFFIFVCKNFTSTSFLVSFLIANSDANVISTYVWICCISDRLILMSPFRPLVAISLDQQ